VAFTGAPRANFADAKEGKFLDERQHAAATAALYPAIEHVVIASPAISPP